MSTVTPQSVRLEMRRIINAPIERVFNAWTDPGLLQQWLGKGCHTGPETRTLAGEIRSGGWFRFDMKGPNHDVTLHGTYREVTPPTRLVFTWRFGNGDCEGASMHEETLVTVQLRDVGGGTEIHLVHEGFLGEAACGEHRKGWGSSFDKLDELVRA